MQGRQHLANMESPVRGAVAREADWFHNSIVAMKAHKVPPHHIAQLLKTQVTNGPRAVNTMMPVKMEIDELNDEQLSQCLIDSYGAPSTLGPSAYATPPAVRCCSEPSPTLPVSIQSETPSIHDSPNQPASQLAMTQLLALQGMGPAVPSLWGPVSGSPAAAAAAAQQQQQQRSSSSSSSSSNISSNIASHCLSSALSLL